MRSGNSRLKEPIWNKTWTGRLINPQSLSEERDQSSRMKQQLSSSFGKKGRRKLGKRETGENIDLYDYLVQNSHRRTRGGEKHEDAQMLLWGAEWEHDHFPAMWNAHVHFQWFATGNGGRIQWREGVNLWRKELTLAEFSRCIHHHPVPIALLGVFTKAHNDMNLSHGFIILTWQAKSNFNCPSYHFSRW